MIYVYPPDCTDFSTNGNGALSPISCEVSETLNGEYEVTLVHPVDEAGKWQRLIEGCIMRVPVPIGMTPYVNLPDTEIKVDKTTRGVWRITSTCCVRSGPDNGYKIVGTYQKPGVAVSVIGSVYTVTLTHRETGAVLKKYYSSYPTDTVPEGFTRTIALWYKVTVQDGSTGYTQGGISNSYHSESIETIVGETVQPKQYRDQPFRIYRIVPELDRITVYARHIFYDLLDYMVQTYTAGNDDRYVDALRGIISAAYANDEFTFYSDISDNVKGFKTDNKNPLEAILGDEGLIAAYGGELCRDWYDVYVVNHIGEDRNVQIREGKNLLGISYDVDTTDVVTRIMPTGQKKNGDVLYLPEIYVDSENIDAYPHPKWIHMEVSEAKIGDGVANQAEAYVKLREAAHAEFEKGVDQPKVTLTVDFLNLYDTEEYRQYGFLQDIYLGDSVRVISSRLGLSVSMRMTQYTYDCLKLKYTLMTLGTVADTVADNTISSRQLPSGIISGSKLAINAVGTSALQDGAIKAAKIDTAAVGTAHIQEAAITTAAIADLAVTGAKIADGTITNAKIGNAAIDTANIADAAITNAKIGNAAVDTANIADAAVKTAKVDDAAITRAKIASLAVGSAQIDDLAVTTAKLANAAITNAKIANAAIDTAKIALGAITAALIQNGAIGTAQIADASITEGKIVSLNADVITSGTLATDRLIITGTNGLIYEINAEASGLTMQELSDEKYESHLSGSVLVARSVTAEQIAAATITANEILSGTITGDKIAAATITGSNIKAGAITTSHLSSNFGEVLDLSSNVGLNLRVAAINEDIDELREEAVADTQVLYALSSSSSTAPTTGWSANAPPWEDGRYMWQKTVTTFLNGDTDTSTPTCLTGATGATGEKGEAATTLRIESSRGTVFKRDDISTVLSAVIYHGSQRITDITALRSTYGSSAYLQWKWRRRTDNAYGTISASDTRISDSGFSFTVSADDVDANVTFMCELITD